MRANCFHKVQHIKNVSTQWASGPSAPVRPLDIEALFRHSIEPAGFIFVAWELQCVENAVKIYDADFKVCVGWRT